jgi:hypothetical protein
MSEKTIFDDVAVDNDRLEELNSRGKPAGARKLNRHTRRTETGESRNTRHKGKATNKSGRSFSLRPALLSPIGCKPTRHFGGDLANGKEIRP